MSQPVPGLTRLQLVAIGPPTARLDDAPAPVEVLWRKNFALLIYLALSPGFSRSRGHLMALLWPERNSDKARHSLNEALHRLRSCLGPSRLVTAGESVALSDQNLIVDAWQAEFDQKGEFLEGFSLDDSQPFDEWVEAERRHRRLTALSTLVQRASQLMDQGNTAAAVVVARTARERDPLNEAAIRVLMEGLALVGDHGGALDQLRDYRQRMAEVGETPPPALTALAERIRSGLVDGATGATSTMPGLVGRETLLARLSERLPLPGHTPTRVLLVLGEGGQGKTRILEELKRRAGLAGLTVASARALPSDQGRPRSVVRGLFRGGLLLAPGLLGVDPIHLRTLASAVPELATKFGAQDQVDDGELAHALAEVLKSVADEAPLLLLLDDAHLADGPSLAVLRAALVELTGSRVTLGLTAAPRDPDSAPELLQLEGETGRSLPGITIRLEPLGVTEVAQLVEQLAPWLEQGEARDRMVRRLIHETSGNPFLTVTLLRGLADLARLHDGVVEWPQPKETLDGPLPLDVPQLIQSAVLAQVTRLEPASRETLAQVANLGTRVDLEILTAATGLSELELSERLALPEQLQLITATDAGYAFPGAVIASVLEHVGLTPGRRREFRRRAADLLALRSDPGSRLARFELLARLGPRESFAAEAIDLGEALLNQGDRHGARRALRVATDSAGVVPEESRAAWLTLRNRLDREVTPPGRNASPAS